MLSLDSLARRLATRRLAPRHDGRPLLASGVALVCATAPLLAMIQVYTSSV